MKKWMLTIFFSFTFLCLFAPCTHAVSTSSVLSDYNVYKDLFGIRYSAPTGMEQRTSETVDTDTGSLNLNQVDLTLPGKNGTDLVFSRSYNSQYAYQYWTPLRHANAGTCRVGKGYLYQNAAGFTVRVQFRSEDEMQHYAADGFYAKEDFNFDLWARYDIDKQKFYNYNYIINNEKGTVYFTRVKTVKPITLKMASEYNMVGVMPAETGYQLGLGWMYNIPHIYFTDLENERLDTNKVRQRRMGLFTDMTGNIMSIESTHIKTGDVYEAEKMYIRNAYGDRKGMQVEFVSFEGVEKDGFTYHRTITDAQGRIMYFKDEHTTGISHSKVQAIEDRYGNRITYHYAPGSIEITDTYGRIITVSIEKPYQISSITYPAPDGSSRRIEYDIQVENDGIYDPQNFLTVDNIYSMTVRDAEGMETVYASQLREQVFEYEVVHESYINGKKEYLGYAPTNQSEAEESYNLISVTYPTGAQTEYAYERRLAHLGNINHRVKYMVKNRADIADSKRSNEINYTYDNKTDGLVALEAGTEHSGTATRAADGYSITDTYKYVRLSGMTPIKTKSISSKSGWELYTYEIGSGGRLTKQQDQRQCGTRHTASYVYDTNGNKTKSIEDNFEVNSTYDLTYNLPITTTYKQDANTTILQENTLTEDKKSIDTTVVKVNDVIKSKTKFTYDQYGNVTAKQMWESDTNGDGVLDENDETVTLKTDYTYNPDHTWSLHNYVENVQGADGNTEAQIGYTAAYDALGNVKTVTDPNGNTTTYTYDIMNRPIKATFADGTTRQLSYNIPANEVTYTDENGTQTKSMFDPLGQIEKVLLNDAGWKTLESYEFNNIGQQVKKTTMKNASDYTTEETTYNPDGTTAAVRVKNAAGETVTGVDYAYTYTRTGKTVSAHKLNDPVTTIQTYDLRDRLAKEEQKTAAQTHTTTYEYDNLKNVIAAKDARANANGWGNTTTATYDHMGNVLTQTNALGNTITNTYNLMGQLMSSSDYKGNVTTYVYDKMGRNIQVSSPFDGTNVSKKFVIYDKNGNVIREKSQNNAPGEGETYRTVEYVYNSKNQVTAVKQFDGNNEYRTAYTYDNAGHQTSLITGAATSAPHTTSYTYNKLGQVVSETDPMGGTKTAAYDYLGNVIGGMTKAGETITNTYNDWNLPVMQQVTGTNHDTNETRTDTRSFTYDNLGRKISATNESGTATYEYDDFGRMVKETDVTGAIKEYTYDENSNRLTFKLTIDGTQQMNATYTYDKLNQLTGVTIGGDTTTYGYDANGNIVNKTTGALVTTYSYNNGNMLTEMNTKQGSANINTYAANYFLDGNLKRKTGSNATIEYQYNDRNQLIEEVGLSGILNSNTYQYDTYGNLIVREEEDAGQKFIRHYVYNENNQLLQEKLYEGNNIEADRAYIYAYTYDANGNQRYRTVQTTSPYADSTTESINISIIGENVEQYGYYGNNTTVEEFTYNGFGERTGAIVDGTTAEYAYNPDGLRIGKTVNGETTTHILDGGNVVADIKDGAISKYNRGRELISIEQNGNKGYYTFNGHGDVTGIVDSNGDMKNQTWFYAYGYEIYQTATVFDNPFRYAGEYTDAETGNIYLRARYYDPTTGRFTSNDTHWNTGNMIFGDNAGDNPVPSISAIMQSVNLYAYCSNNPMNKWDPTGLADEIRYVNTGGSSLRMRVAPGTDSKIIMSIPDGAEVKVIGYRSTRMFNGYWWTTVKYNGQLGFVAESYLSEKPPLSANIAASSGASNTDNNRRPSTGDPGSTYTTPKGDSRTYGPDGKPEIDVDQPHGHNSEPHVHRWPNGVRGPAEPMPSDNNWGAAIAGGIITIIEIASYLYGTPIDLPGN